MPYVDQERPSFFCDVTRNNLETVYRRFGTTYTSYLRGSVGNNIVPKIPYAITDPRRLTSQKGEGLNYISRVSLEFYTDRRDLRRRPFQFSATCQ